MHTDGESEVHVKPLTAPELHPDLHPNPSSFPSSQFSKGASKIPFPHTGGSICSRITVFWQ